MSELAVVTLSEVSLPQLSQMHLFLAIKYTVVAKWRSPADRIAGLGGLTVQVHCLSKMGLGQSIIIKEIFLHAQ